MKSVTGILHRSMLLNVGFSHTSTFQRNLSSPPVQKATCSSISRSGEAEAIGLCDLARQAGFAIGRKHVVSLMRKMGITALYRRPNTSRRHPAHPIYPYLLRNRVIERPNQVWAMDITYIPMRRGFVYLAAVLDWASRRVLAWRVSISLTTDFCLEAVEEALAKYGRPEMFNTDPGCQFTSSEFTGLLKEHGIAISMDGKGCWRDNVFVERLWKTIKYEEVYLRAYDSVSEAKA